MAHRATVDVNDNPDLRLVVDKVRATYEPIVLQEAGEDVAIVLPIDAPESHVRFKPTPEQIERAMSAAGGWKGIVDADELKAQIKAVRGSNRPTYKL